MSLRGFISDRGPFLRRTIPQLSQLGNRPALRSAFSRGETCQYLGGFHQLGRCAREGREGGTRSGFIDLALCFAFPVAVSLEGQMTLQSPPVDENRPISGRLRRFRCQRIGWTTMRLADECAWLIVGKAHAILLLDEAFRWHSASSFHRVYECERIPKTPFPQSQKATVLRPIS